MTLEQQQKIASLHEQALASLQAGDIPVACQMWNAILQIHPTDEVAQQYLSHFAAPAAHELSQEVHDLDAMNDASVQPVAPPVPAVAATPVPVQAMPLVPDETPQGEPSVPGLVHQIEAEDTEPPPGLVAGSLQVDYTSVTQQPVARTHVTQEVEAIPVQANQPVPVVPQQPSPAQTVAMPRPDLSKSVPASSEADALVHSAQQALDSGDLKAALDQASRAMATDARASEASGIIAEAQARAKELDDASASTFTEAMQLYEQGKIAEAYPLFVKTLEIWPDHPDAPRFLERCQSASATPIHAKPKSQAAAGESESGPDSLASIPLAIDQSTPAEQPVEDELPPYDPNVSVGDQPPFEVASLEGLEQENFMAVAAERLGENAGGASDDLEPVVEFGEVPAQDAPASSKPAKSKGQGKKLVKPLIVVAALAVLGVAGWILTGMLGGSGEEPTGQDGVTQSASAGLAVPSPAQTDEPPASESQEAETQPQDAATEPVAEEIPAPPPEPRKTAADVPQMIKRAQSLSSQGREQEAVELLEQAQSLDPSNFAVMDELSRAKEAAAQRQKAQSQIDEAKAYFNEENYSEALRLFYRVPKEYRPKRLTRWIADGWYNIGVQGLKTGRVVDAYSSFNDALQIDPGDSEASKHLEVARRYRGRELDEAYALYVKRISLRGLR